MASIVTGENLAACRKCGNVIRYTDEEVIVDDYKTYWYYNIPCPKPFCGQEIDIKIVLKTSSIVPPLKDGEGRGQNK